jgi:uncharacterized protein YigE (DUF2233 family)
MHYVQLDKQHTHLLDVRPTEHIKVLWRQVAGPAVKDLHNLRARVSLQAKATTSAAQSTGNVYLQLYMWHVHTQAVERAEVGAQAQHIHCTC